MDPSSLSTRLREILRGPNRTASSLPAVAETSASHEPLEAVLGGEWQRGAHGACFIVERVAAAEALHGRATVREIAAALRRNVWPVLEHGRCGPVIHTTFPLAEVAAAHTLMESSAHIGKIMLRVAD